MMTIHREISYGGFKQVFAVSVGLFLVFLDTTIVNIAMPSMTRDLQIELGAASWIINAFVITVAVLLVALGKLADIFGSYRTYMAGLLLFMIASLLCGFAPNASSLIVYRVLQGIGAAAVIPASMVLVRTAVPPNKVGAAMGVWGGIGALAIAIGPSLGGLITKFWSWEWIFFINLPVVAISTPLATLVFANYKERRAPFRMDILGVVTLSASLFFFTYGILQGQEEGWGSVPIIFAFIISLVSALSFLYIESKVKNSLIELEMLRNRVFMAGMAANFLSGVLLMGTLVLLPVYFTQVKGFDILTASLMITPLSAVMLVVAPLIGRLIDTMGYFTPMLIGFVFAITGFCLLSMLQADVGNGYLIAIMAIAGTGIGILMVTSVTIGTASIPEKDVSLGSAVYATTRNMGGAVGVALFVSVTLSFTQAYSTKVVDDGIQSIVQADLPAHIETRAIQLLEGKADTFFDDAANEREDASAFELSDTERRQLEESGKLAEVTEKIQGVVREMKALAKDYMTRAMAKAFACGLVLSVLLSISLPFLRERKEY